MSWNRFLEFFEDQDGGLSMTRLLCFLSFFPASYVVITTKSVDTLAWYLGAYVLGYVGGKTTDIFMKNRPPAEPSTTNNTFNQAEKVNVS
jgi:hypothetical protein